MQQIRPKSEFPTSAFIVLLRSIRPKKPAAYGWGTFTASRCCLFYIRVKKENIMLGTILLIVLVLLLIGALPTWPYSGGWGYYPSSGLGLVLVVILILVLMGRV
jgi:hypothetical protein